MFKFLLTFLSPQVIFKSKSQYNPDLTVQRYFGKNYLYVSNTQQSGPWEDKIWKRALWELPGLATGSHEYQKILILGLGAGNLAKLISNNFQNVDITGVEIDEEIIKIGKKYFELEKIPNLKTKVADAFKFVQQEKAKYDLIFVDLFVGENAPEQLENEKFLKNLSQTVSKNGLVIFNRLTTKTANFELDNFVDKLHNFFKIERVAKFDFNNIIFCSRKRF